MSLPTRRDKEHKHPPTAQERRRALSRRIRSLCIFSMLGAIMFASKIAMEWAPNIHLLGMFTMAFTIVYRVKGLIPVYVYAAILCVYNGFAPWCIIHLYVWTILWGVTILIPEKLPKGVKAVVYPTVCALHGLSYGFLCGFSQVPIYFGGFTFHKLLAYTASGFYFDVIHAIGNLVFGMLILPLSELLSRLERRHI